MRAHRGVETVATRHDRNFDDWCRRQRSRITSHLAARSARYVTRIEQLAADHPESGWLTSRRGWTHGGGPGPRRGDD